MADPVRLDLTSRLAPVAAPGKKPAAPASATAEKGTFAQALAQAKEVKFSNHAQQRLEKRQISLSEDGLARLANAVDKAGQRGGRESMVLMDDLAFIVNVKERVIVTALDPASRREGVFTQIDSVVFADPKEQDRPANVNQSR